MSAKRPLSAGLLLYRRDAAGLAVLLVHPGGPFWRKRWTGAWQIPKGLIEDGEPALEAARREFGEELGMLPAGAAWQLGTIRQVGGKRVEVFAQAGEFDVRGLRSNRFALEWPPKSQKIQEFPEIDAARWFSLAEARREMLASQAPVLGWLEEKAGSASFCEQKEAKKLC